MASDSLVVELGQKLDSMKKRALAARETAEAVTGRGMLALAGAAGAVAAGVLQSELGDTPKLPGTDVEADLALGGLATVAGAIGIAGKKWSEELVVFGVGLMAPGIARQTKQMMSR